MNPLTDFGFKRIFGDEKIMIAFLTDLLEPKSPIESIEFLDKEMTPDTDKDRGVVYDLRCRTADCREFIVEMQNKSQMNFSDRIIFYISRSFSSQGRKGQGDWNFTLNPVYGVFFMNFHMKGLKTKAIRTIQLKVNETGEVFSEKLKAFTLELPKYKGKPKEYPRSKIEYWLYNLVNMENMNTPLPYQEEQPVFNKMAGLADLLNLSEEERDKYFSSLDAYRTHISVLKNERAEGVEEGYIKGRKKGIEEGIVIGREEERNNLDKKYIGSMFSRGMNAAEIAKLLDLEKHAVEYVIKTLQTEA